MPKNINVPPNGKNKGDESEQPFNNAMGAALEKAGLTRLAGAVSGVPEPFSPEEVADVEKRVEEVQALRDGPSVPEAVEAVSTKMYSDPWRAPGGLGKAEHDLREAIEVANGGVFPEDLRVEVEKRLNTIRTAVAAKDQKAVNAGFRTLHEFGDSYIAQREEKRKNLVEPPRIVKGRNPVGKSRAELNLLEKPTKPYQETKREFDGLVRALRKANYEPTDPGSLEALGNAVEQLKFRDRQEDFQPVWTAMQEMRDKIAKDKKRKVKPASEPAEKQEAHDILQSNRGPEAERVPMVPEEGAPMPEGTRREWKVKLRGLIEGAKGKLGNVGESIGKGFEKSSEFLSNRGRALGTSLKNLGVGVFEDVKAVGRAVANPLESLKQARGGAERAAAYGKYFFDRNASLSEKGKKLGRDLYALGENYRKLPLRYKLYLAGALIGGSVAVSGASVLLTTIFSAAKLGSRALSGTAFYTLLESLGEQRLKRREAESGTERTRLDSWKKHGLAATAGVLIAAGLPGAAIRDLFVGGEEGLSWLHGAMSTAPSIEHAAPLTEAATAHGSGLPHVIVEPQHAAVTPEITPPVEMPSVEATHGHGYEYMAKRLWEDIHDPSKHFALPAGADPNSDLAKLFAADKGSVDALVHRLASDHGFYEQGSELNVRIDPSAHLTFIDGQLHFSDATHADVVQAPEDAATTPPYHPESAVAHPETPPAQPESAPAPEHVPPVHETAVPAAEALLAQQPVYEPSAPAAESVATHAPTLLHPEVATPQPETPPASVDHSTAVTPGEAAPAPGVEPAIPGHPEIQPNHFGLRIDASVADRFADPQGNQVVYGGSLAERVKLATDWVSKDHKAVVYFDFTKPGFLNLFPTHHIGRAFWDSATNSVQAPDDTMDPSLRGLHLPSAEDLKVRVPSGG